MAQVVERLGERYEVEELIGAGGMGEVFRARDLRLERTVAVKRPSEAFTGSSRERFRREAQSAARLNHPHVVTVFDWGDEGTDAYLVMEYVEGRSLRALLSEHGPLAPAEVARVGAQIADALAHAHAKGVIHRDVKPSNVLLTTVGTVKVTDFGIAQSGVEEALTEPGVVIGTAGYLAPEQVAGQRADARSDIYSLGVLLTELLTGSRDEDGVEDGVVDVDAGGVSGLAELRRVIRRARAGERQARYARATELREALRACARDTGGLPAIDPALASAGPLTGAVIDVPTATVGALTGTVADPTRAFAKVGPVAAPAPATAAARAALVPAASALATTPAPAAGTPAAASAPAPVDPGVVAGAGAGAAAPVTAAVVELTAPASTRRGRRRAARRARAEQPATAKPVQPVQTAPPPAAKPAPSRQATGPMPDTGRRWRLPHVVWLVAAPVTLALAAAGVLAYRSITMPPETTVPAVIGRDVFAGAGEIEQAGLEYRLIEVQSAEPAGVVLGVHPRAGRTAREGDTVDVRFSSDRAFMPDVIGMNEADATAALRDLGLVNITPLDDFTDAADPGTVTATQPFAHLAAMKANTITVSIARDPHVVIPTGIVRTDQAAARARLEERGLVVVTQTESSRTVPAGQVIALSPREGVGATRGDTVVLRVSSGPKPVSVPYVVGYSPSDAAEELRDEGFAVEIKSAPATKKDAGKVMQQTPSGGQAPEGSTVTITIGLG